MIFEVMEEGTPCDYCGRPVEFMYDDWMVCPVCRAEYSNIYYVHGDTEINADREYSLVEESRTTTCNYCQAQAGKEHAKGPCAHRN